MNFSENTNQLQITLDAADDSKPELIMVNLNPDNPRTLSPDTRTNLEILISKSNTPVIKNISLTVENNIFTLNLKKYIIFQNRSTQYSNTCSSPITFFRSLKFKHRK